MTNRFKAASLCLFIVALVFSASFFSRVYEPEIDSNIVRLTSREGELSLIENGKSDYKVVFSADTITEDYALGSQIQMLFAERGVYTVDLVPDTLNASSDREILIGKTSRAESEELLSLLESRCERSDDLAWGYAVMGEKVLYLANSSAAFEYGKEEFIELISGESMTLPKDLLAVKTKPLGEYEEELRVKAEKDRLLRIEWLKSEISSFDDSLFGERTPMPSGVYDKPHQYPTEGQHPRLNVTEGMLPAIREILGDPAYSKLMEMFYELADAEEDGKLTPVSELDVTYNWDGEVLARIEAKAFMYLLTGDELYGYEAIYAMKNHMLTLDISHDLFVDLLRPYGWSMMVAGEVYDWCYDLMTDLDKSQFVRGVEKYYCEDCPCGETDKMTIGFPPTLQGAVQGHGTNVSLHRDYLAFSIAIFDEYPDWYELVGGRFYNEYVPTNNIFYAAGMNTQGNNIYVWGKYYAQLYSAWIIQTMCGEMPYDDGIEKVAYGLFGMRLPNGKVFLSGDGDATADGKGQHHYSYDMYSAIYLAMALFPSEVIQRNARIMTEGYTYFRYDEVSNYVTPTTALIFRAAGYDDEPEGEKNDGVDLLHVFPSPMGLITARDKWGEDGAAVYMKVGEVTGSNHDHEDSGTFQIYYKGCFTAESGLYAGYGSSHHCYWHQATIAHNGVLVYNPELKSTEGGWYSGGQETHDGVSHYSDWLTSEKSRMGHITGIDTYVDPVTGEIKHAYISGDISEAYSAKTVDILERRMLAIYTSNPDYPLVFTVYDYVKSKDASFKKSFLMHTVTEPEIDRNTAVYTYKEGKLVLTTLTEDAAVTKIGGKGRTYWINDEVGSLNLAGKVSPSDRGKDGIDKLGDGQLWGRVQVESVGRIADDMLNVIYATDADNDEAISLGRIETERVIGHEILDVVAIFSKTESKNRAEISFETKGKGLARYYLSGFSEGSWTVKVDGFSVARAYTAAESGLISFIAPKGTVTVTPGADVRPANSDDIKYVTAGVPMPDDAVYFYVHDAGTSLPIIPDTETRKFLGWYTDDTFTERWETVPDGTRGTLKLYARFDMTYLEDYEKTDLDILSSAREIDNYVYMASGKPNASFKTVEENGNGYLVWNCGTADPQFSLKTPMSEFLAGRTSVTFTFDAALDGDNPAIASTFRLRGETSRNTSTVFKLTASGELYLGGSSSHKFGTLDKDFATFTVTVDFAQQMILAFDEEGNLLAQHTLVLSSADAHLDGIGYMYSLIYIYDWYAPPQGEDGHALRIDNIKVNAGYPENSKIADPSDHHAIIYKNLGDGILPTDAPYRYSSDGPTKLPENIISPSGNVFLGWYKDEAYTEKITEIPADADGAFTVYASFAKIFKDDFDNSVLDTDETENGSENSISYITSGKAGASFKAVAAEDGGKYLVWTEGSSDPSMSIAGSLYGFLEGKTSVTYKVSVALPESGKPMASVFRVQETGSKTISVFTTNERGEVLLAGDKNLKIFDLTSEFRTVTVTVDFLAGTVTAYNDDGEIATGSDGRSLVAKIQKPAQSEAKDLVDYISFTKYYFVWYASGVSADRALHIDDLSVMSGSMEDLSFGDKDSNGIYYIGIGGASLPEDAPKSYDPDKGSVLPKLEGVSGKLFAGWYADAEYTERISEIPIGTEGDVVLYARWLPVSIEDFESEDIDLSNPNGVVGVAQQNKKYGDLTYYTSGKLGASFKTESDGQGNSYLVFTKGAQDPQINKDGPLYSFLGAETQITLSLDLALNGDASAFGFVIMLRKSGADNFALLTQDASGAVFLGAAELGLKLGTLSSEFKTFTVVFDFATAELLALDENGEVARTEDGKECRLTVSVPKASSATNMLEWLKTLQNYNFVIYSGGSGDGTQSLRFDNIIFFGGKIDEAVI